MNLEEQIAQFREFTGYMSDDRTAEDFIRGNDSLEKAIQAFYDDPSPLRYREARSWNEGSFSAGKDGARSQMEELPPYQMDQADQERESRERLRPLGAPSRPPSRARSRISLRSGRELDMQTYGPQRPDDEDEQMREAIRLSMEDQQTGIIGASGIEYVPDVEIQDRVRKPGEPAFLKPLPKVPFLPALVTILHSIPQCRETFLSRYDLLLDYGNNKRWWEGEPSETMRIIDASENDAPLDDFEILHEVQRLMAFLDATDRSYGSVGALSRLSAIQNTPPEKDFARFLHAWQLASEHSRTEYPIDSPFRSVIQSPGSLEGQSIHCVEIPSQDIPADTTPNLYDVLDNCFWPAITGTISADIASLSQIAPIMVLQISPRKRTPGAKNMIIPTTLFADRYMSSSKDLVKQMRTELAVQYELIGELEERLSNFDLYQHPSSGKSGSASKLMDSAIEIVKHQHEIDTETSDMKEPMVDAEDNSILAAHVLERLEQLHNQLRTSMQAIEQDQAQINATIKKLSTLLTDPLVDESIQPKHEFKLRGVALATANQSQTMYFSYPPAVDDPAGEDTAPLSWWRISYDTAADKALVSKEQVPEQTVLNAAGELISDTLLVYASTAILGPASDEPLAQPLQDFVALDNASFRLELGGSPPPVEIIEGVSPDMDTDTVISETNLNAFPLPPGSINTTTGPNQGSSAPPNLIDDDEPIQMHSTVLDPTLLADTQTGVEPIRGTMREMQVSRNSMPLFAGGNTGNDGNVNEKTTRTTIGQSSGVGAKRNGSAKKNVDLDEMDVEEDEGGDSEVSTLVHFSDDDGDSDTGEGRGRRSRDVEMMDMHG